jgi:hypothetical protein
MQTHAYHTHTHTDTHAHICRCLEQDIDIKEFLERKNKRLGISEGSFAGSIDEREPPKKRRKTKGGGDDSD